MPPESETMTRKLAVFDLDSTLIRHEMIDELADLAGKGKAARKASAKSNARTGMTHENLRRRVRLLKGLRADQAAARVRQFRFHPHFAELVEGLKRMGFRLAVVSGAFYVGWASLKEASPELRSFDDVHCNHLQVRGGKFTGKAFINVADNKHLLVRKLRKKFGAARADTLAVGDSMGDAKMFAEARVSIAFNPASKRVEKAATHVVRSGDLLDVLRIAEKEFG
jgi:phosphoserine phosphatase